MVRHYLNRIDDTASNDEWSYISQLGSDIEFKDVMEVNQRYITFDRRLRRKVKPPKTKLEATKEGIRWALDAAGNTGQYIKFVNMTIDKRQAEIDKIKKLQNKLFYVSIKFQDYKKSLKFTPKLSPFFPWEH